MSYNLTIPFRRLEGVFGIAYPSLSLSEEQKGRFIQRVLANKHQVMAANGRFNGDAIGLTVMTGRKEYAIDVMIDKRKGYDIALAIEKWMYSVPRLTTLSPPRFWNKLFRGSRPKDSYLISDLNMGEILEWLDKNATIRDYQIYSKFGQDFSLGFKNTEISTMFKLTFGDKDV